MKGILDLVTSKSAPQERYFNDYVTAGAIDFTDRVVRETLGKEWDQMSTAAKIQEVKKIMEEVPLLKEGQIGYGKLDWPRRAWALLLKVSSQCGGGGGGGGGGGRMGAENVCHKHFAGMLFHLVYAKYDY